jgi:hypothetical protein
MSALGVAIYEKVKGFWFNESVVFIVYTFFLLLLPLLFFSLNAQSTVSVTERED